MLIFVILIRHINTKLLKSCSESKKLLKVAKIGKSLKVAQKLPSTICLPGLVIIVSVSLCFVASFLFKRSFFNCLFPEHPFYVMMNSFLLQRPALDIRDLPLFYPMFNSSTMQVRSSQSLVTASVWTVPHYMKYLAKYRSFEKATILPPYSPR